MLQISSLPAGVVLTARRHEWGIVTAILGLALGAAALFGYVVLGGSSALLNPLPALRG